MALTLMKGSEAIAEAAIRAGARFFFGYPITPQTEIPILQTDFVQQQFQNKTHQVAM